jgi:hypothetical protein
MEQMGKTPLGEDWVPSMCLLRPLAGFENTVITNFLPIPQKLRVLQFVSKMDVFSFGCQPAKILDCLYRIVVRTCLGASTKTPK